MVGKRCGTALFVVLLMLSGCDDDDGGGGSAFVYNSECEAPLVCRSGACVPECRTQRDCPLGTSCILVREGQGACQPEADSMCVLNSDCPEPLVCGADSLCRPECLEDRDCPTGRACIDSRCVTMADAG